MRGIQRGQPTEPNRKSPAKRSLKGAAGLGFEPGLTDLEFSRVLCRAVQVKEDGRDRPHDGRRGTARVPGGVPASRLLCRRGYASKTVSRRVTSSSPRGALPPLTAPGFSHERPARDEKADERIPRRRVGVKRVSEKLWGSFPTLRFPCKWVVLVVGLPGLEPGISSLSERSIRFRFMRPDAENPLIYAIFVFCLRSVGPPGAA